MLERPDECDAQKRSSTESMPFDKPTTGKVAVKVINHYGDEVQGVFALIVEKIDDDSLTILDEADRREGVREGGRILPSANRPTVCSIGRGNKCHFHAGSALPSWTTYP